MLRCSNSDPVDDSKTREAFIKGNSLFSIGTTEWHYGIRRYNGQIWSDAIPV